MSNNRYFRIQDIPLIGIFSALWVILNFFVAPISFALTGLPTIHVLIVFFVLLLVVWMTGRFGSASFVGLIGSAIVLLLGGPPPMIGFAAASVIFDVLLVLSHHKLSTKLNMVVAALATVVSSYVAANINGLLVIGLPTVFSLTVWSALNLAGAILSLMIALPAIGYMERAKIKQIKNG
jgi:hypothetical protein